LAALKDQDDSEGVKAAELSKRHTEVVVAFTGNDPDIEDGLRTLYRDRANLAGRNEGTGWRITSTFSPAKSRN
jgi:hypothetical protein